MNERTNERNRENFKGKRRCRSITKRLEENIIGKLKIIYKILTKNIHNDNNNRLFMTAL